MGGAERGGEIMGWLVPGIKGQGVPIVKGGYGIGASIIKGGVTMGGTESRGMIIGWVFPIDGGGPTASGRVDTGSIGTGADVSGVVVAGGVRIDMIVLSVFDVFGMERDGVLVELVLAHVSNFGETFCDLESSFLGGGGCFFFECFLFAC